MYGYLSLLTAAELLGLPLIPPYSQASGEAALHGVNYASAAAGILDITGQNFVSQTLLHTSLQHLYTSTASCTLHPPMTDIILLVQVGRIPFNQQIKNFESTLDQIAGNLGADAVASAIAHCIFFVGMGSNDYLNNYLMPNYNTRSQYTGEQFADLLVQEYTHQLTVGKQARGSFRKRSLSALIYLILSCRVYTTLEPESL